MTVAAYDGQRVRIATTAGVCIDHVLVDDPGSSVYYIRAEV